MAIRTKYQIFCTKKTAPLLTTYDKVSAYVEFNEHIRNPQNDMYRLAQEVESVGELTKQEEYFLLVYHVRKAIRRYYDNGRKQEDLKASLELESQLDKWNKRTKNFMASHPAWKPKDTESHAFYVLVSEWRKAWHERMGYRKRTMGYDQKVMEQMSKKCREIEKQIDKYIKDKLQLL